MTRKKQAAPREHSLITKMREGETPAFSEFLEAWSPIFPLLGQLENTPQDPEWHAEGNVAIHTGMVLQEMEKLLADPSALPSQETGDAPLSSDKRVVLTLSALFHDIGKPLVTKTAEVRGRECIVSPRHAAKGRSYLALRLPNLGLAPSLQDEILTLVGYHHDPRKLVMNEAGAAGYSQLARMVDFDDVETLELADLKGRQCADLEEQLLQLKLFRMSAEDLEMDRYTEEAWVATMENMFIKEGKAFQRHAAAHGRRDFEEGRIRSMEEAVARAFQLRREPGPLTILAGPAGSGKSTWIEEHAGGSAIVSLDALRESIAGKRSDQSKNGQVMQAAKEALKVQLRAGNPVIWDATNTRRDGRGWVASLGFQYGAPVRILAFRNSHATLKSRNRKRSHPIPDLALAKQIDSFEWPTLDEAHWVEIVD